MYTLLDAAFEKENPDEFFDMLKQALANPPFRLEEAFKKEDPEEFLNLLKQVLENLSSSFKSSLSKPRPLEHKTSKKLV